jgi:hypothetical protein
MSSGRLGRFTGVVVLTLLVATSLLVTTPVVPAGAVTPGNSSVGVYPTTVNFDQALRGGQFLDTIGVINGTPQGQYFDFGLKGPAAPWLKVVSSSNHSDQLTRLWAPSGAAPTTAVLELQVPTNLANGAYKGQVTVAMAPPTARRGQTSVGLAASIDVEVEVTGTQVVAGALENTFMSYPKIEVGEPLRVFAVIKNSGNVTELPKFGLEVIKSEGRSPQYTWQGTTGSAMLPGQTLTYQLIWPGSSTYTQTYGDYKARLSASFTDTSLGSVTLPFQLVPYGSLHRGGKLLSLQLVNHPKIGDAAEVQASVLSTGEVQQETYFVGQFYRNGQVVQGVKSPVPVLLLPGQSGVITMTFPMPKDGLYELTGLASFDGAKSGIKTLSFRIGPPPIPWMRYGLIALGAVVLLAVLILLGIRRRRRPVAPIGKHITPRYATPAHTRNLHVPPRSPVGSSSNQTSWRQVEQ